jgi:DNA-binding Lrp family transcriptional regulator
MAITYLLVNCKEKSENSVLSELKTIPQIRSVLRVIGPYDFVIKIQIEHEEEYKSLNEIVWSIKKMNNVRSTMTLVAKFAESTIVN